jgi:hypothetical protein
MQIDRVLNGVYPAAVFSKVNKIFFTSVKIALISLLMFRSQHLSISCMKALTQIGYCGQMATHLSIQVYLLPSAANCFCCFDVLLAVWMDMPLDVFLHDVPEDRVWVSANFHSLFTDAFFIRNDEVGRELALDWLAIIESGWVQCHGFDQVQSSPFHLCIE